MTRYLCRFRHGRALPLLVLRAGPGLDAPLLRRAPRLPGGAEHRDLGRFRLLRQPDLGAHHGDRDSRPEHGGGRRNQGPHAALRRDPPVVAVPAARGTARPRRDRVHHRAARALPRAARRAGDHVPPRPERQRARVQELQESRRCLHAVRTAGTVVVGAGVVGASAAYHLAARGVRDILILERVTRPGEGSTGAATGGYRASVSSPIEVRLSLLARESLRRFREEIGADPGYVTAGYLWLAVHEKEMAALRAALEVQHAEGLSEARLAGVEEIARLNPWVRAGHAGTLVGGLFCPTAGFIDPLKILEGYLAAAARRGARVECGVQVTGILREGDDRVDAETQRAGRIVAIQTTQGPIAVGSVVNAAGPWAASLAALAGIALPVTQLR